jgi:hypothetical protein
LFFPKSIFLTLNKNTMRIVIILVMMGMFVLGTCNQNPNAKAILENSETRKEIFEAIGARPEFTSEFMASMRDNQAMTSYMMQGNGMQMMIKDRTTSNRMVQGMMGDPQMMQTMMGAMMQDGKMMENMMQMMHTGGMMSADCMQSSIKMMGDNMMRSTGTKN